MANKTTYKKEYKDHATFGADGLTSKEFAQLVKDKTGVDVDPDKVKTKAAKSGKIIQFVRL